jgi:hypothetical protein
MQGNQMNSIIVETHHNEPDASAIKFRFCGGSDIVRGTGDLGRRAILLCRKLRVASRERRRVSSFQWPKKPWTYLDDAQSEKRSSELGRRCARSLSKQQTGQQRRRRQAPANHTCRALNANHMLFALFWTSHLRTQTPASVFTPNQRTTPLSSMMISVAS